MHVSLILLNLIICCFVFSQVFGARLQIQVHDWFPQFEKCKEINNGNIFRMAKHGCIIEYYMYFRCGHLYPWMHCIEFFFKKKGVYPNLKSKKLDFCDWLVWMGYLSMLLSHKRQIFQCGFGLFFQQRILFAYCMGWVYELSN